MTNAARTRPGSPAKQGAAATRVLVVDDDAATCELIQTTLLQARIDVTAMTDSQVAAARLRAEKFDCVFLDVHIPPLDGIELVRQLRTSGINQRTPVVIITGDADPSLLARGYQAGANFFLNKPIDRRHLLSVVRATHGPIERERRRFRRIAVRRKVDLRCENRQLEGETLDMSLNGLFVQVPGTFPPGSRVEVRLHLNPGSEPNSISGRIARVVDDNHMGIYLDAMKSADAQRLQEFLLPLILAAGERGVERSQP